MERNGDRIERLAELSNRFADRPGARSFARLHGALNRYSNGRFGRRWMGSPVIVLETIGRRSGRVRRTPVLGLQNGHGYVVVAANAGADTTPAWYLNLTDAGRGVVIAGGARVPVEPRLPVGDERDALWARFVAMHPAVSHYRSFTERDLPLVALEPVQSPKATSGAEMPTIDETERFAAGYLEAWRTADPDRIAGLHALQGRFAAHAGGGGPVIGRNAMRSAFTEILERFPGFGVEVRRLLVGPGHWALDWTLTADDGVRIGCLDLVELTAEPLVDRKDTWIELGGEG